MEVELHDFKDPETRNILLYQICLGGILETNLRNEMKSTFIITKILRFHFGKGLSENKLLNLERPKRKNHSLYFDET